MSLFLEERIKEQIEDPVKDNIVFTHPWIIEITPQNEQINFTGALITFYRLETEIWAMELSRTGIKISGNNFVDNQPYRAWKGSSCFLSYDLFYDNNMRFLLHSSPRTKMTEASNEDTLLALIKLMLFCHNFNLI